MRRRQSGFTLLELLVAIMMVSLLTLTGLYAMRAGFLSLEKTGANLNANRRVLGAQRVLEQTIAGFYAARADCHGGEIDVVQRKANIRGQGIFFEGGAHSLRLVSSFSLEEAARGAPRIVEITTIPGERNEGVRLIANEDLYWGPLSTGYRCRGPRLPHPATGQILLEFLPIQAAPRSFILADRLAKVQLYYRRPAAEPPYYVWLEEWPFAGPPGAIRIEMTPLDESARATVLTVPLMAQPNFSGDKISDADFAKPKGGGGKWDDL